MNFLESAQIVCTQCSDGAAVLSWKVAAELTQIHGFLHGGISAAVAEHAASLGSHAELNDGERALGLSVESHHLKAVPEGSICTTIAQRESGGSTIQVWRVEQYFESAASESAASSEAPNSAAAPSIDQESSTLSTQQRERVLFNTSNVTLYIQKAQR